MPDSSSDYINSIEFSKLTKKFTDICESMDDLRLSNQVNRALRYVEIDIESERARGKLAPDELLIPQHIINTNIRREQPAYVQYVVQSPRAVILKDLDDPSVDTSIIENDATSRIRYDGWQSPMFANIDGFQQNGYGWMEVVDDETTPGNVAHEVIAFGDFGIVGDTKNVQEAEMTVRDYYYTRTGLLSLCADPRKQWNLPQVKKVIEQEPTGDDPDSNQLRDKSLFRIQKVMFRVNSVVMVAWASHKGGDDWLRPPRPLYLGYRRAVVNPSMKQRLMSAITRVPITEAAPETEYPYILFPYLISENATISMLKGRAFLDQDIQQAVISIISSYCTGLRRSSGLYFSRDVEDPNDDILMKKNVYFKQGVLLPSKVKQMQLVPPSSDCMAAVNMLMTTNQNETSQVNFAAQNRKDSRKTATEVSAATQAAAILSTVQVVLFSIAMKTLYSSMFRIIQSRVNAGLIKVRPDLVAMYQRRYAIKPSGDTDVIERQQMIAQMMQAWPVVQSTPAALPFLVDMLTKMFPDLAPKYVKIFQDAQAQQQSQQAQMQQQMMQQMQAMAGGIVELSKHADYFSDIGKIHALPSLKQSAAQIEQAQKQLQQ